MTMSQQSDRLNLIDVIRGITILSMIGFHTCWDLYYFNLGVTEEFITGTGAYIWQQSICWSFILISGFSFVLGHKHLKHGLLALGGGIIITIVTCLLLYDERDIFGVLYLHGISILLMILIDQVIPKDKAVYIIGLLISAGIFFLTKNVYRGFLGFEGINICALPEKLYRGYFMTFLGFKDPEFYSSDYFPLLPWFFLFAMGYFLAKLFLDRLKTHKVMYADIRPLSFIGRHSLIIYMLHQVVIYGVVFLIARMFNA